MAQNDENGQSGGAVALPARIQSRNLPVPVDVGTEIISAGIGQAMAAAGQAVECGFVMADDVPFEDWRAALGALGRLGGVLMHQMMRRSIPWQIGDILGAGEARYGEAYSQAMGETGLSYSRLAIFKSVAGAIPLADRRPELSFDHHVVVMAHPDAERNMLLDVCVRYGLNRPALGILASMKDKARDKILAEAVENDWTTGELVHALRAYSDASNAGKPDRKPSADAAARQALEVDAFGIVPGLTHGDFTALADLAGQLDEPEAAAVEVLRWLVSLASDETIAAIMDARSTVHA